MYIDDNELKKHLSLHTQSIGHSKRDAIFNAASSFGFLYTVKTGGNLGNPVFQKIIEIASLLLFVYSLCILYKAFFKNYTYKELFMEIKSMDKIRHKHSLIALQDTFREYPARFLVYWDNRWNCELLPNCFTPDSDVLLNVKKDLSSKLKIPVQQIDLHKVITTVYSKFSYSDRVEKYYEHTLFQAVINDIPDNLQNSTFEIDGITYRWMTIHEMKENENIMKKNGDVIELLEKNIHPLI